jgi:hypothetical protein
VSLSLWLLLSSFFLNSLINDLKKYILTFLLNWYKTNQSPTLHSFTISLIESLVFVMFPVWTAKIQQCEVLKLYYNTTFVPYSV